MGQKMFCLKFATTCFAIVVLTCSNAAAQGFNPIASEIEMHPDKRITAGDDIIVFGTGGFSGVDYMVPSAGDTNGRGIPGGKGFHASSFAVAGKKIALIQNFEVTIFDTVTQSAVRIPSEQIRLTTVPGPLHAPGHMHSDGNYIICRSDRTTSDKRLIKIIDVEKDEPEIISFEESPPVIRADFIKHVMVDAENKTAVAATDEAFFIYRIDKPSADPVEIEVEGGIAELPPQLEGDFILFQDRDAFPNTKVLQISTKKVTRLKHNPSAGVLKLTNGSMAYFVKTNSNDSVGNGIRIAIGTVNDLDNLRLAPERRFINGRTANHGAFGYGETVAISPDGDTWMLGGLSSVGAGEYLQISQGNDFQLVPDPRGKDRFGCYATDVTVCNKTVAFKTKGPDYRAAYVGYMLLK